MTEPTTPTPAATSRVPRRRLPRRYAVVTVAALVAGGLSAPALADGGPAAPSRVTGLSVILDIAQTGSDIGVPEVYGLGESALVTFLPLSSLPPQAQAAGDQVVVLLDTPPQYFQQLSTGSDAAIAQLRTAIAPLAVANPELNMGIDALTAQLDSAATMLHPAISPADVTVFEFDQFARSIEEH